jgi:hypothetical protein
MASHERLGTYLNDHLMGAAGALDMVDQARSKAEGTPLAEFLDWLRREIEADRDELAGIVRRLDLGESRLKQAVGSLAEKASRVKLGGDSELSLFLQLESLELGILGKRALWLGLGRLAAADPELAGTDYERLVRRATDQAEAVERRRQELVPAAFA